METISPLKCIQLLDLKMRVGLSSSMAVDLAKKYESRLHVLHISTAKELALLKIIKFLKKNYS